MNKKYVMRSLVWLVVSVLVSMLYQYIKAKTTGSGSMHWGTSIGVVIGGSILGFLSALIFLVIDYFTLRKKEVQTYLLVAFRFIILSVIILIMSTRSVHDLLFG